VAPLQHGDMMVAGDQIGGSGASCSHLTGGSAGWSVRGEASGHQPSVEGLCSPVSSRVGNDGLSLSEGGRCDSVSPPRSYPQPEASWKSFRESRGCAQAEESEIPQEADER